MALKASKRIFDFFLILFLHLWLIFTGLQNTITDRHAFRQTQTAITAYYFSQGDIQLDYLTPVMGYPWSIPFEFPLYQAIVAGVQQMFSLDMDVAGRIISIMALYGTLLATYFLLKSLSFSKSQRLVVVSVILFNPTLLFWGRSFMIETTALLLSVLYLMMTVKTLIKYKNEKILDYRWLAMVMVFGALGALVKITTFLIYLACSSLFVIHTWYVDKNRATIRQYFRDGFLLAVFSAIVPITIAFLWTQYTDAIKKLSYLGSRITSANLNLWNFGSLDEKFSLKTWTTINANCFHYLLISVVITIFAFVFSLRHRFIILIFTFGGVLGPLLFTNLYMVHDYYSTANTLLFSLSIALFVVSVLSLRKKLIIFVPASIFIIWIFSLSVTAYFVGYYHYQVADEPYMKYIALEIKAQTSKEDVLMIVGNDWSSELPYYSERKSVCIPEWMEREMNNNTELLLEKFKSSNVTALVAVKTSVRQHEVNRRIARYYGFSEEPIILGGGNCLLFMKGKTGSNK